MIFNNISHICSTGLSACTLFFSLNFAQAQAGSWLTTGDRKVKLQKQKNLFFSEKKAGVATIFIDDSQKFQTVDGFGFSLTGGSVETINRLSQNQRKSLLHEIFGNDDSGIGVSFLRISIGASDLNKEVFTYDDIPAGETDTSLSKFSLEKDHATIAMLQEILDINPGLKIIAVPWTPPLWMKDNKNSVGGSLNPAFYKTYAAYFVKYIQEMAKKGIRINAVCPQNEPLNPKNNPSMYMTSAQQQDFIKNYLGPAFRSNSNTTKIVLYDHNCDHPEYATNILQDPAAAKYIDGSAFHLYGGDVAAMGKVHDAFPNKNLYFTEQWTGSKEDFNGNLNWHVKNVIIGTMRNWSKIALEWNLANDQNFEPHTSGGCDECKGAITIQDAGHFTRNVSYYIIAHAAKFVPAGSVRIASSEISGVNNVAFRRPDGKIALIAENENNEAAIFNIKFKDKTATASLPSHSVATYVF